MKINLTLIFKLSFIMIIMLGSSLFIFGEDAIYIDSDNKVGIGTTSPGYKLEIVGPVMLENATAPTSSTNHSGIYSSSGELYAIDDAGNTTQLSPHDEETGEWVFFSRNIKTGRVVKIKMEQLVKKFEEITGEKFMEEWVTDIEKNIE